MTPRQTEILRLIKRRGAIRARELAKALGCTPRTAGQHLWLMGRLGLVRPSGVGCLTTWSVAADDVLPVERDPVGARVRSVFEWRP